MKNYSVQVGLKGWTFIIGVGVAIGFLFGSFSSYLLYGEFDYPTALAGLIVGSSITSVAAIFVPFFNSFIKDETSFWVSHLLGFLVSFLSGFFGFLFGYVVLNIVFPHTVGFVKEPLFISILVGTLSYCVGLILYFFQYHKVGEEELKEEVGELRLTALESQLNSHFVHNTLNVLAELVHKDVEKAEDGILVLSKMLRTIASEEHNVDILKELAYIEDYVEIIKLQHNELIQLNIDNREEKLDFIVPKFALQLFVENAIKYGFKGKELIITVEIVVVERMVFINIINKGEKIENLIFGTGLKNVESRVKILNENNSIKYKHVDGNNIFTIEMEK
ncbi:MAG: histidine kinase [Campylobacterales bacterium]|nr:histidine kinase [Campylobacterales bacterium]